MLYTQFRENEKTARYEVKLVPGNRCQLVQSTTAEPEAKARTKKPTTAAAKPEWTIGVREETCWVDMESEFKRLRQRAPIDLGLRSGEEGGAGGEILYRLDQMLGDLYASDSPEDYLTYLGLLNVLEYFRLIAQLKRTDSETGSAKQIGIVGDEYFECRKLALELDIAELTEWLVAHDIGIPDLSVFYPAEYKSDAVEAVAAPKKKGRKKAGEEVVEEAPQQLIPEGVRHVAELIRLHQADTRDLVHFIDDVMKRGNFETHDEAIAALQQVVSWIEPSQFESQYRSLKREQALETARQQASIMRQHEAFDKKPKRGIKIKTGPRTATEKKEALALKKRERKEEVVISPLDEFASSFDEDPESAYERAMEMALDRPDGMEFVPADFTEAHEDEEGRLDDHHESEGAEAEAEDRDEDQHDHEIELLHDDHEEGDEHDPGDQTDAVNDDGRQAELGFDRPEGQNGQGGPRPNNRRRRRKKRPGERGGDRPFPQERGFADRHQADRPHAADRPHGGPPPGPRGPRPDRGPRGPKPPRNAPSPRGQQGPRQQGPRQPNFDEIQPASNYSPGLVVPATSSAAPGSMRDKKKQWRKR